MLKTPGSSGQALPGVRVAEEGAVGSRQKLAQPGGAVGGGGRGHALHPLLRQQRAPDRRGLDL